MAKHTAGPWIRSGDIVNDYAIIASPKRGHYVAMVCGEDRLAPYSEQQANAALIAAAPEMLAALKSTLPVLEYVDKNGGCEELIAEVRSAIAKAETSSLIDRAEKV